MTKVKELAVKSGDALFIPRGALVDAVRGLNNYEGIGNVITCSDVGECNALGLVIIEVVDGEFEALN